jgi:hypothetical protein
MHKFKQEISKIFKPIKRTIANPKFPIKFPNKAQNGVKENNMKSVLIYQEGLLHLSSDDESNRN